VNDEELRRLAELFVDIDTDLTATTELDQALAIIARRGVAAVPGADFASITRARADGFETVVATDEIAARVDEIQYQHDGGPCVDAVRQQANVHSDDLATDQRWPAFGAGAAAAGIRSVLSCWTYVEDDGLQASINLYGSQPGAFDDSAQLAGLVLATHGAVQLTALRRRAQVAHLERALASSREIGMAMGILMAQHKVTGDEAFGLLRIASQHGHRKLAEIARDVVDAGILELPGRQD
jgi:hypothetical protein